MYSYEEPNFTAIIGTQQEDDLLFLIGLQPKSAQRLVIMKETFLSILTTILLELV
jgi:hypothetical protein